jgi:hypothetical protein
VPAADPSIWVDGFNGMPDPERAALRMLLDFDAFEALRGLRGWRH